MTVIPFDPETNAPQGKPGIHPAIDGAPRGSLKVTITYLGMDQAPAGMKIPPPHGQKLALIRAIEPTLSFYRYLYDHVGEPWLWFDRRRVATHVLQETITNPRVEIFVLYVAGVPAGFAELDCRKEKVTDLAYFGLIPDFIGRGLGPFLLDSAIRRAWDRAIDRLTVNTCTFDHPKALSLYQKVGFEVLRQEHKTIHDPRISGILPETAAPHIPISRG